MVRAFEHALAFLSLAAPPRNQVEDENDDSNHDEDVDEAATDMKGEAQKPQNYENHENCPKHRRTLLGLRAPGTETDFRSARKHSRSVIG